MAIKGSPTEMGAVPSSPAPVAFDWSYTYDGPIEKLDDPTCDMCIAVRAGKCLKGPGAHGAAGCTPACSTGQAARMGFCHNHHGIASSIAAHPNDHKIVDAHKPTFDAASRAILDSVASLPKDTKRILVKLEGRQNPELTMQTLRIELASWR